MSDESRTRIVAWGGYDLGKPRVRLLLDSLRERGALAAEINIPVWTGVEDKSMAGRRRLLKSAIRLLAAYPPAMIRLLRRPAGGAVLLPYPGIPDIFFVWPIAALRRHKILLDAFIPLHDAVVGDRALLKERGLAARALQALERSALGLADIVIADTDQHGDFLAEAFGLDRSRIQTILVGAEPIFAAPAAPDPAAPALAEAGGKPIVLFYGQLIPLHGLATILAAISRTGSDPFHWVIVGRGQEEDVLRSFIAREQPGNLSWIPWIDYERLPALIAAATVALGIFGTGAKSGRVIPNKLFQVLAAGRPVITRASPAVEPLASAYPGTVITVPAGDGAALADAVRDAIAHRAALRPLPPGAIDALGPAPGVAALIARLDRG